MSYPSFLPRPHKPSCSSVLLSLSSQTAVETRVRKKVHLNFRSLEINGFGFDLCVTVVSHIKQKSLGLVEVQRLAKEHLECVCSSQSLVQTVRMCVFAVCANIASPLLDPTSRISRGSVLVSPGDSQSVLALQYTEIIVIFKKLPQRLGTVFCRPMCGTAPLEYVCVRAHLCAC